MKSRWDEVKSKERRCNSAKVRRKKIHPRQMLETSWNAVFFPMICVSGESNSRLVKAESCGQRRNQKLHAAVARSTLSSEDVQNTSGSDRFFEVPMSKNCTPLWREAHFQVKMCKTRQGRTTFWSSDVEKLRAAVTRSAFSSENVQNTSGSDRFLEFRCLKIAHRCGEKHRSKWKLLLLLLLLSSS